MQHRVTVRTDGDQISLRVHGFRGSPSVERPLVVDVDEVLTRIAIALLETQVTDRASQTMMIDAAGAGLGIALVAIHRDPLDIPFLIVILLAQLAHRGWVIGRSQAGKSWTGERGQSASGFVTLVLGKEVPAAFLQCKVLDTEVRAASPRSTDQVPRLGLQVRAASWHTEGLRVSGQRRGNGWASSR